MKTLKIWTILVFVTLCQILSAQDGKDRLEGMAGENFSLEAALDAFKSAASPEDFEKMLNMEDNDINNLDLNEDGNVDYVMVRDDQDGDTHALVIYTAVNEQETQDIAVIGIQKTGDASAELQIIGNDDLYGEDFAVEPYDEKETGGKGGPSVYTDARRIVVNVWGWPTVRFIYAPIYRPWVSPWRWAVYPTYYRPWRVRPVTVFRPLGVRHRAYYRPAPVRVHKAVHVYKPHRRSSTAVKTRTTKTTVKTNGRGGKKVTRTTTTRTRRGKR